MKEAAMSEYLEITADKFTFRVAVGRLYTPEGVWALWIEPETAHRIRVGLTDFLQQRSGDLAFLSVRPPGTTIEVGGEFAELETIKVNLSVHSPVAGTIVEVNQALELTPEVVNKDPYGAGWLAVVETVSWEADRGRLLDAAAYLSVMQGQVAEEVQKR
jgi:glycine cleavage system H protein